MIDPLTVQPELIEPCESLAGERRNVYASQEAHLGARRWRPDVGDTYGRHAKMPAPLRLSRRIAERSTIPMRVLLCYRRMQSKDALPTRPKGQYWYAGYATTIVKRRPGGSCFDGIVL